MTNKEKTIMFIEALCILLWMGAAVITSAAALNGCWGAFVSIAAVLNLLVNLGLAGLVGYGLFFKKEI